MTTKETLSDKMFVVWRKDVFYKKDVKEFIKKLKEELQFGDVYHAEKNHEIIDKLAGENLI